jgi:acyl-CoA thioesterase-1
VFTPVVNAARAFPRVLLAAAALFAGPACAETRILALGDSLTAGYGLAAAESFPAQLERALRAKGHAVSVLNAGVSGDTSAGGLARLAWSLGDSPAAAIVELGANDGLRGLDPAATRRNLAAILARLAERRIPVLLAGMRAPPNLGSEYVAAFDSIYPALAREYDVIFYPFFLEGVVARPELNQADGIHPTGDGVAEIVRRIVPAVERLLARVAPAAGGARSP